MRRRTARGNRLGLALIGLLMLTAGGYTVARSRGLLASGQDQDSLYTTAQARWVDSHTWIWIAVAAAAVLTGLLALRWLAVQSRLDRIQHLHVDDDSNGRTSMPANILTEAIEDDILAHPGVTRVRAVLTGTVAEPVLDLTVHIADGTVLADVRNTIITSAVPAGRCALDTERLPTLLQLTVGLRRAPHSLT